MKKNVLFAVASLIIALPSCKKDNPNNPTDTGKIAIQLTASQMDSRLKMFNDAWEIGDMLGLFITNHSTAVPYESNTKLTYNSGGTLTADNTLYYPDNSSGFDFVAYYPYSGSISNGLLPLNIPSAATMGEEVLYSNNAINQIASSKPVNLEFNYVLPKIVVKVSGATPTSVSIGGVYTSGTLDLQTGTAAPSGSKSSVLMAYNSESSSYEKLLLPTTVTSSDAISVTVVMGGGVADIVYNLEEGIKLEGTKVYRINISATTEETHVSTEISTEIIPRDDLTLYDNTSSVIINGVKWATRNVDAPGTFAATPESAGMFYQWNRKQAWSATGTTVTGWDATVPTGTTWEKSNDPSPKGWRVPTKEEQQSLVDKGKVTKEWTTQNGITGILFTDIATGNQLFLPAAGNRSISDGTLSYAGAIGFYWSSTALVESSETNANCLTFDRSDASWGGNYRRTGFSVRCVAE